MPCYKAVPKLSFSAACLAPEGCFLLRFSHRSLFFRSLYRPGQQLPCPIFCDFCPSQGGKPQKQPLFLAARADFMTRHRMPDFDLNEQLKASGLPELEPEVTGRFEAYLALLLRWNTRLNLTAVRDVEGILSRHFVESIACARAIPEGVRTLLDFGSGAGFPGIPIALCRPEISVTLAESRGKKAAFLQEAVRTLRLGATVWGGPAETLRSTFDCVVMRAVDRMREAVSAASRLVSSTGWLILMTTGSELASLQGAAGEHFAWHKPVKSASSNDRLIATGKRAG